MNCHGSFIFKVLNSFIYIICKHLKKDAKQNTQKKKSRGVFLFRWTHFAKCKNFVWDAPFFRHLKLLLGGYMGVVLFFTLGEAVDSI